MDARDRYFLEVLEGHDKRFIIPVYQRNYDWKKEHCETLFDDIVNVISSKKDYFIGSLVLIYDSQDEFLIIDGQQRITTISLLLLSMCNYLKKSSNKDDLNLRDKMLDYLIDKYADENKKIRLKPIKSDNDAFESLFSDDEENIKRFAGTNIVINYKILCRKLNELLSKNEVGVRELFEAIKRLKIVKIDLKSGEDNP